MIDGYIDSFEVYEDLLAKSQKGIDFYRKLESNMSKLVDRLKGVVAVREEEREKFMGKYRPKGASLSVHQKRFPLVF